MNRQADGFEVTSYPPTQPCGNRRRILISLGGSLMHDTAGININFLSQFKCFIETRVKNKDYFLLVCGGGNLAREYQSAAKTLKVDLPEDLDRLGIATTRLNALLIRVLLREYAYPLILVDPRVIKITPCPILVSYGSEPGHSSDFTTVMFAKYYRIPQVINLSNTPYVFSGDPKRDLRAVPYKHLTWDEYLAKIGECWQPGLRVPFDPIASREAALLGLTVVHLLGTNLTNLQCFLDGQPFVGTTIEPEI